MNLHDNIYYPISEPVRIEIICLTTLNKQRCR